MCHTVNRWERWPAPSGERGTAPAENFCLAAAHPVRSMLRPISAPAAAPRIVPVARSPRVSIDGRKGAAGLRDDQGRWSIRALVSDSGRSNPSRSCRVYACSSRAPALASDRDGIEGAAAARRSYAYTLHYVRLCFVTELQTNSRGRPRSTAMARLSTKRCGKPIRSKLIRSVNGGVV